MPERDLTTAAGIARAALRRGDGAGCHRGRPRRIATLNPEINAYTDVTADRALAAAAALDADRRGGRRLGPLAGVPYAVKNLFDVAGLPTRADSRINRERPPAAADAVLVRRMDAAGGVLLGALNMGEYAYDFTGENAE